MSAGDLRVLALESARHEPQVDLRFACRATGRTWLAHQRAAYPFHVGAALDLRAIPPGMATVYCSAAPAACSRTTTCGWHIEAARRRTGARDVRRLRPSCTAWQRYAGAAECDLDGASRAAISNICPISLILFPGARLASALTCGCTKEPSVLPGEIVLAHDPQAAADRCFDRLHSDAEREALETAALLARDRWTHAGRSAGARPAGHHRSASLLKARCSFCVERQMPTDAARSVRAALPAAIARLYIGASRSAQRLRRDRARARRRCRCCERPSALPCAMSSARCCRRTRPQSTGRRNRPGLRDNRTDATERTAAKADNPWTATRPTNCSSQYLIETEPYYRATGNEVELYEAAYAVRMPMMLKGPTGCGKTRFVEYMAWQLGKPLVTIACHEDMTASDLVGPPPARCRGHALAGRAAHTRGALRRDLLSGRDRRGAPGHHRGDPSAHRRAPRAAAGEERRAGARASRISSS